MDWTSIFDMVKLGKIAMLTMVVIQYVKEMIPEAYIRAVAIVIGIAMSLILDIQMLPTWNNFIMVAVNGIFGAILADTTYGFLSDGKSTKFSLPSKGGEKE